ncbi:hypothetical protein IFO70_20095 [Phormidium tenue FACHB-886]|nr:hypothetical protein [Phormidium tenue FACHB-886]
MTDTSMPNQAAEPDQDIASSQQAQLYAPPNAGGSALLDANLAAGETTNPKSEKFDDPIATNFSSGTGTGDVKTADASTVAGAYSADSDQSEEGTVHLQNSPNLPGSDPGTLPDTDQIALPINPDVNLQD